MDFIVLVFSLVLLRLPKLFASEPPVLANAVVLVPFWIVIIKNLLLSLYSQKRHKVRIYNDVFIIGLFFVLLVVVLILRSVLNEAIPVTKALGYLSLLVTMYLFGLSIFLSPLNRRSTAQLRIGIFYALGAFIALNVLLHFLGIDNRFVEERYSYIIPPMMLSLAGIEASKIPFALSSTINGFGHISGSALVGAFLLFFGRRPRLRYGKIAFIVGLASTYGLIMSDTRGALIFSLMTILIIRLAPKKFIYLIPLFIPFLSCIFIFTDSLLSGTHISDLLSRSEGGIFSNRSAIWSAVLHELSDVKLVHFIGFGLNAMPEGIVDSISYYFKYLSAESNFEELTAHHILFQYILDIGYLGTLFFVGLNMLLLHRLAKIYKYSRSVEILILIGILIYMWLLGSSGASITLRKIELFTIFLFLGISTMTIGESDSQKSTVKLP